MDKCPDHSSCTNTNNIKDLLKVALKQLRDLWNARFGLWPHTNSHPLCWVGFPQNGSFPPFDRARHTQGWAEARPCSQSTQEMLSGVTGVTCATPEGTAAQWGRHCSHLHCSWPGLLWELLPLTEPSTNWVCSGPPQSIEEVQARPGDLFFHQYVMCLCRHTWLYTIHVSLKIQVQYMLNSSQSKSSLQSESTEKAIEIVKQTKKKLILTVFNFSEHKLFYVTAARM